MRPASYFSALLLVTSAATASAQAPSAEQILKQFRPAQRDVVFDTPEPSEFAQCKVDIERGKGSAGFVVYGPAGQVLRRFTDTNGDSKADLFRFYHMGLEVYRDIDSDKNEKPDEHRWMNWGGVRWGVDKNEDGRIDSWKMLSAQEAAQIAVESIVAGDVALLSTVLVSEDDIRSLGFNAELQEKVRASLQDPATQVRKILASTKSLTAKSKWVRFDPSSPGLIPKEEGKANRDLIVYENAMAIVENSGNHELISVGEMVRVGDVWKLTQLPSPLDSEDAQVQIGGILMQPQVAGPSGAAGPAMSKEMETLLSQLQEVDENSPSTNVTPQALAAYNQKRADLIERIIKIAPTEAERLQWIQQYADGIAAAVQTGEYDAGLKRLTALEGQVKANSELLGYVYYRRLLAEYAVRLKTEDPKARQEAQDWWLKQLEVFAGKWPKSADASDAMVQLAISLELVGRIDDARRWYAQLLKDHPQTNAGVRARGALRRLDLAGKQLELAGKTLQGQALNAAAYRGKVTLVVFWATWAQPYTAELPRLTALHKKYQRSGFEILGVNLDADPSGIPAYIKQYGGNWNHLRDEGGTDGRLAKEFGIVSVPTMFLVEKTGRVAGAVTSENLESAVQSLLLGKPITGSSRQGATGTLPTTR